MISPDRVGQDETVNELARRALYGATFIAFVLTGCSTGSSERDASPADFETTFTRIAPSGYIDMSLDFANPTNRSVTLRGRLIARDGSDGELPRVEIKTAFETEKGRAVVMPGGSVDFVQLRGPGADQVREITFEDVEVKKMAGAALPGLVELTPVGADRNDLEYDMDARQVRLENPYADPARVRIVLMVLQAPQDGVAQQAILVRDVATVDVEPKASKTVDLDSKTISVLQARGVNSFVTLRPVLAP